MGLKQREVTTSWKPQIRRRDRCEIHQWSGFWIGGVCHLTLLDCFWHVALRGTRGAAATPLTGRSTSLPSEGTLAQLRLFVDDVQCVNTVLASIWRAFFWRASLEKQNRKTHWHFESWICRRCCLQCAENIRSKQPEQARCQAVSLGERREVWGRPLRISCNAAAALWVWFCTSCFRRPALTRWPLGSPWAVF